jgi:DNA-binding NarL/FixJ family response regulator
VIVAGTREFHESAATLLTASESVAGVLTCGIAELASSVRGNAPDIVVVELAAHDQGELGVISALATLPHAPRILLVCHACSVERILPILRSGVDGCIAVEEGAAAMRAAFDAVCDGAKHLGSHVIDLLMRPRHLQSDVDPDDASRRRVTPREAEILELLASGLSGPDVARKLRVSPRTVHVHRTRLMRKLDVHNVAQLLWRGIELGLIRLPPSRFLV